MAEEVKIAPYHGLKFCQIELTDTKGLFWKGKWGGKLTSRLGLPAFTKDGKKWDVFSSFGE